MKVSQMLQFAAAQLVKLNRPNVKIFAWLPGMMGAMVYYSGPESLGGRGKLNAKIEEGMRQSKKDRATVAKEVCIITPLFSQSLTAVDEMQVDFDAKRTSRSSTRCASYV